MAAKLRVLGGNAPGLEPGSLWPRRSSRIGAAGGGPRALLMLAAATLLLASLLRGADVAKEPATPVFVDVTEDAGVRWGIRQIARGGWNVVETMGGGGGFVDYDGDGWLDLYFVSYSLTPQPGTGRPVGDALFRNNGNGTFTDVTAQAGIGGFRRGQGLAVGDYDNDGFSDLFISAYGSSVLYHNEGDGTFREVTRQAGVESRLWGSSTTFLDYDRDGWLDIFLTNYLEFKPASDGSCTCRMYGDYPLCPIADYEGEASVLYHNNGDGTFTDVSAEVGIANLKAKGMGVVAADLDGDGWTDLFQVNDTSPNMLLKNQGGRRLSDVAFEAGVAFGPDGETVGAMSTDAEDVDGDGRLDLLVTSFNHQPTLLGLNRSERGFVNVAGILGLDSPTYPVSNYGARFLDHDNDGHMDIFIASGHPFVPVSEVWPTVRFAERPFLFACNGRRYTSVAAERGEALQRPYAGRGVATGDYDNDGDPDILLLCAGEPPRLLRNDGGNARHWIGVKLVGSRSSQDPIGARVTMVAGGKRHTRTLAGGASYLSASDMRLLFGLDSTDSVETLQIEWPSGQVDTLSGLRADQYVTVNEGSFPDLARGRPAYGRPEEAYP
jgi:hypothetical protein